MHICSRQETSDLFDKLFAKSEADRLPYSASMEITKNCNFKCIQCYNSPHSVSPELSFEKLKYIVDQLVDNNCFSMVVTGGEPLLHRDFEKFWEYTYKKGVLLTLFTNGFLADQHLDLLEKYPPFLIEITLYGFSDKTYQKVTGRADAFDRVMKNIREIKRRNFNLMLKSMVLKQNVQDIVDIYRFAKKENLTYRFDPFVHPSKFGDDKSHTLDDPQEIAGLFKFVRDEQSDIVDFMTKVDRYRECFVRSKNLYSCNAGRANVFIDYLGNVQPCASTCMPDTSIFKRSVSDIMTNDFPKWLTKESDDESALKCRNCQDIMFCAWCGAIETHPLYSDELKDRWRKQICGIAKVRKKYMEEALEHAGKRKN